MLGSISTQIDSIKSSLVKLESLRDDLSSILTKLDDKMELLKKAFRGSNLKDAKRQMLSENFTDFLAIEN